MSKKVYQLIVGIAGAVSAAAVAIVTFCEPQFGTAINGAIVIANTAVDEICSLFVKEA